MVKQLLYGIILVGALMQALIQPLIYIEYKLRKDYIIAELCKERYASINTCDGRCFLVKKLSQSEQRKSEEKERSIKPVEIKLRLIEIEILYQPIKSVTIENKRNSHLLSSYFYQSDLSQDKPPQT